MDEHRRPLVDSYNMELYAKKGEASSKRLGDPAMADGDSTGPNKRTQMPPLEQGLLDLRNEAEEE